MKRGTTSSKGGSAALARDLPPGARLTTKGTTEVAPLPISGAPAPTTAVAGIAPTTPVYPTPPQMPTGTRLADHHYAAAVSQKPAPPAAPLRPHRPTFDEPLPQVKAWRANAQALRRSLGDALRKVEQCIAEAGALIEIFAASPEAAEQAAHEGVDLAEAREFHASLVVLVARYQPQTETAPPSLAEETTDKTAPEA